MRESLARELRSSIEIGGSLLPARKKTSKCLFGEIAAMVWPKPDFAIAEIADCSDRQARDYLRGKAIPPAIVFNEMEREILRRSF